MSGLNGPTGQRAHHGDALKTIRSLSGGCAARVHQAEDTHILARPRHCDVPRVNQGDYSGRNVARRNGGDYEHRRGPESAIRLTGRAYRGDYARRIGSESAIRFIARANRGDYEHRGASSGGRRWAAQLRRRRMLASTKVPA
jgi:hypothetical protein